LIFREAEDPDLVKRARRGGVDAYNLLVSRWEKRVFNYLLRLVGDREDALDLTQEAFLKAYQSLGKLQEPSRFAPWLFRIAHNEAFSHLRRKRPEVTTDGQTIEDAGGTPVFPRELSIAVNMALTRLSEEQRETVVLKIYQGFKFEEMGGSVVEGLGSGGVKTARWWPWSEFELPGCRVFAGDEAVEGVSIDGLINKH